MKDLKIIGWQVRSRLGPSEWDNAHFEAGTEEPKGLGNQYETRPVFAGDASNIHPQSIRLRPLEWKNGEARTPFWTYFAARAVDGNYRLGISGVPSAKWTEHLDLQALEEAATADYRARIVASLMDDGSPS